MRKLMSANFRRLFGSKIYWLCMIFMFGFAAFSVCSRYFQTIKYEEYPYPTADALWFIGGMYISVAIAIFISLWIGTDYSDGTIRNKLMIGHTRCEVYLSNWIVCNVGALLMHMVYILIVAGLGCLLLEPFETPFKVLGILSLVSLLSIIALTSIFVLIAMLIHTKSTGAVVSLVLAITMILGSLIIYNMLNAPEYIDSSYEMTISGEVIPSDPVPNPNYLDGVEREFYQYALNTMPTGQMVQYGELAYPEDLAYFPLYSVVVILMSTAAGLVLFRRKDIK